MCNILAFDTWEWFQSALQNFKRGALETPAGNRSRWAWEVKAPGPPTPLNQRSSLYISFIDWAPCKMLYEEIVSWFKNYIYKVWKAQVNSNDCNLVTQIGWVNPCLPQSVCPWTGMMLIFQGLREMMVLLIIIMMMILIEVRSPNWTNFNQELRKCL